MSLFQCSKCGCCENTASSDGGYLIKYLIKKDRDKEVYENYKKILGLKEGEEFGEYCCVCNPAWFYAECTCGKKPHEKGCKRGSYGIGEPPKPKQWHNIFPRTFLEKGKWKTNREGNLQHIETGETDFHKYEIASQNSV